MPLAVLPLRDLLLVFLAGGTGATLRVMLVPLVDRRLEHLLPFGGTLVVNLIGCFAIGLAMAWLPQGASRPIVLGGLLGGFTTYSAFGLLSWHLFDSGRHGTLALQMGLHVIIGIVGVWLGLKLGRGFGAVSP